jgi:hypothetical protein
MATFRQYTIDTAQRGPKPGWIEKDFCQVFTRLDLIKEIR